MKVLVSLLLLVIFVFKGEFCEGAALITIPGSFVDYLVETRENNIQEADLLGKVLTSINSPAETNSDNTDKSSGGQDFSQGSDNTETVTDEESPTISVLNTDLEDYVTHPVYKKKFFMPALNSPAEYPNRANWFQANQYCRLNGMHLAAAESLEEHNELVSFVKESGSDLPIWISGTDLASEAEYVWMSSGKTMAYTRWNRGEPNNAGGIEDCVEIRGTYSESGWNDVPCLNELPYVCEYFEHQVPE